MAITPVFPLVNNPSYEYEQPVNYQTPEGLVAGGFFPQKTTTPLTGTPPVTTGIAYDGTNTFLVVFTEGSKIAFQIGGGEYASVDTTGLHVGTVTVANNLYSPNHDTASAGALLLGATYANAITLGNASAAVSVPGGFSGTPAAPTAVVDTNTVQLATTAFVLAQAAAATPLIESSTGLVGTSTRFARGDHVHPVSAGGYVLPAALAGTLGGVKGFTNLTIDVAGNLSIVGANVTAALGYTPLKNATDSLAGTLTVTTAVASPIFDRQAAGALGIGTAWASSITIGKAGVMAYFPGGIQTTQASILGLFSTTTGTASVGWEVGTAVDGTASTTGIFKDLANNLAFKDANTGIRTLASLIMTPYTLPAAAAGTLGGVKGFTNLTIDGAGNLSLTSANVMAALTYSPLMDVTDTLTGSLTSTVSVLTPLLQASGAFSLGLKGSVADGGSAVGIAFDNTTVLTTLGSKLLSIRNNGTEKSYFDKDGALGAVAVVRTNMCKYSHDLSDVSWVDIGTGVTVKTANSGVAPNQILSACRLVGNNADTRLVQLVGATHASTTRTFSMWLKAPSVGFTAYIGFWFTAGNTYLSPPLTVTTAWQRFIFTQVMVAGDTQVLRVGVQIGTSTVLAWGVQLEAGASATIPIPSGGMGWTRTDGPTILSNVPDTAFASGVVIDLVGPFANLQSVLSVRVAGVEVMGFNATGDFTAGSISSNGTINTGSSLGTPSGVTLTLRGSANDGASAVSLILDNPGTALTIQGSKIVSVRNNSVEKAYIDKNGGYTAPAGNVSGGYVAVTYSASMTLDASTGDIFMIKPTNTTAFTINAPTNPTAGQVMVLHIQNASGGIMGAITWNALFKKIAPAAPANGFGYIIEFYYNGTNWYETSISASTIPN